MNPEPATIEEVQRQIAQHETHCQNMFQSRVSDLRNDIGKLFDGQARTQAGIAAVDERTKQHEGTLLRVEARQNEANRWAIATTIGIVIMLFGMIVTMLKEFMK
jgi:hypothetical protein